VIIVKRVQTVQWETECGLGRGGWRGGGREGLETCTPAPPRAMGCLQAAGKLAQPEVDVANTHISGRTPVMARGWGGTEDVHGRRIWAVMAPASDADWPPTKQALLWNWVE
jgi:hypothetical protein